MRRTLSLVLLAAATLCTRPLSAQDVTLPDYTPEQRWARAALLLTGSHAALVALGREHGMTPEQTGQWLGKFFSQDWLSGAEAVQLLRGMYRNFMAMPGAAVEVVSSSPTSVTARFNRPMQDRLGYGERSINVPGEEIRAMLMAADQTIAEWVGVAMERRDDGDHDILTLTTRYGPIQASDYLRWGRQSYLSMLTWLEFMSFQKKQGLSARQIGEADAKRYGPGWTATTPWQLFRGMAWNWMSDMNTECEVVSASPTEVRARCPETYRQMILNNQKENGVSPEDVFESGRAFAMGVADQLGMRWEESLVNGNREIRITMK
jgi:hypothetical protein